MNTAGEVRGAQLSNRRKAGAAFFMAGHTKKQSWASPHGDANLLRESLEAVQQTAAVILGGIAPEPAALAAAA
jgi:hypothetical protein